MASTSASTQPSIPSSQPTMTWGELCAALEAGRLPATVADGEYVVRAGALRRLRAIDTVLAEEHTLFAKPHHEDVDINPVGGQTIDPLPRR